MLRPGRRVGRGPARADRKGERRLSSVECATSNGVYIHARRDGVREQVARTEAKRLSRHEADALRPDAQRGAGRGVALLTGMDPPTVLDSEIYRRLAGDLRSNGVKVIADLAGPALNGRTGRRLGRLKISEEEILAESLPGSAAQDLTKALDALHAAGAETVLLSRAEQPALLLDGPGGRYLELTGPRVETLEPRAPATRCRRGRANLAGTARSWTPRYAWRWPGRLPYATADQLGTGTREQISSSATTSDARTRP